MQFSPATNYGLMNTIPIVRSRTELHAKGLEIFRTIYKNEVS